MRYDHVDIPNKRSSHIHPTPSGGGIAILVGWIMIVAVMWFMDLVPAGIILAMGPPTLIISAIGYIDDKVNLSSFLRLVTQLLAVTWFIYFSDDLSTIILPWLAVVPFLAALVVAISLIWLINLFNFMDGIDGIAASEATFVLLAIGVLSGFAGSSVLMLLSFSLAGACSGFLCWNWPPAKIFLGNVGAASLGFLIGAIGLTAIEVGDLTPFVLVILLGVFLVDATVTLVRRMASGQRWYSAHRTHTYQKLAIRWSSHRRVTLIVCMVNVGWLFSLAISANYLTDYSWIIASMALAPLVLIALFVGAGRLETAADIDNMQE